MGDRQSTDGILEFGDDRDPKSVVARARQHQTHRERAIATILTDLHLMAVTKKVLPQNVNWNVGTEKAYWQDVKGSKAKGTEAAHCVPCQIKINAFRPEQLVRKFSPERANMIELYFGKTTPHLPLVFNDCDQKCEADGLIEAFQEACIQALNDGAIATGFNDAAIKTSILNAFSAYTGMARTTYLKVINYYESERQKCLFFGHAKKAEAKWRLLQRKIVEHYMKELDNSAAVQDVFQLDLKPLITLYKTFK
jgi:hypothetical protein